MSDDGRHGLTVIAFIGSVFSPYYALARRRGGPGGADPLDHCAVNVALYARRGGPGVSRWAMTERGRAGVEREARALRIGPSALHWEGDTLVIEIDEVTMPIPQRVRGTIRVAAPQRHAHVVALSARGHHRWQPVAPGARVEVDLQQPGLRWSGAAYLDSNRGDAPLEDAFERWNWSRAHLPNDRSAVFYDVERRGDGPLHVAFTFDAQGRMQEAERPARVDLRTSRWGVPRGTRCDTGTAPRVLQTLTDAPFYARSLVETTWSGERVTAMHESLSMPRFTAPWVQAMLPFRMPRRSR